MKKFRNVTALFVCVLMLLLTACSSADDNILGGGESGNGQDEVLPLPDIDDDESDNEPDNEPEVDNEDIIPPTDLLPSTTYDMLIYSKVDSLNIRSGAYSSASVIGQMDSKDMLSYSGEENGYYKTHYNGKTAYVTANSNYTSIKKIEKASKQREAVIDIAIDLLGKPYVYGAQRYHFGNGVRNSNFDGKSYDCSSFTQYAYYFGANINIATTSRSQSVQGKTANELQRGDLMFFTNSDRFHLSGINRIGHVGIYFGDNYILHTSSDFAVIEPIEDWRWKNHISTKTFF